MAERRACDLPIRIAMWSGPRNLSTAMMRAFEARADCTVWDEPFYAPYLVATGIDHPMRAEVIAAHEADPARVAARILGPVPGGQAIWYQKHMFQHMVPGMPRDWFSAVRHAVLIRDPALVAASFDLKHADPTPEDLGAPQAADVVAAIQTAAGVMPPVIEAEDIRANPGPMLRALSAALGIPYDPAMLAWPEGRRETDGIWAAHWYRSVEASTGFAPPGTLPPAPERLAPVVAAARPAYDWLRARKLRPI